MKLTENKEFLAELDALFEKYSIVSTDEITIKRPQDSFKIEKGKWYMCILSEPIGDSSDFAFIKGEVYEAGTDHSMVASNGNMVPISKEYFDLHFRPATEYEIPHEPKFKVGDFICHNTAHHVLKVINMFGESHAMTENVFTGGHLELFTTQEYHLWTIQDAKDGDVLVTTHDNGVGAIIFIFKRLVSDEVFCYCCYDTTISEKLAFDPCLGSDFVGEVVQEKEEYLPATKEQRDLLFSKMKEAGYEWNAEEKDLRKKFYPIFEVGDTIQSNSTFATITEIKDNEYYSERGRICSIYEQYDWNKVNRWKDDKHALITGYSIEPNCHIVYRNDLPANNGYNYKVFATEAQAKSALAMARISQIMANDERFGGVVTDEEWDDYNMRKYVLYRNDNTVDKTYVSNSYYFLAFHEASQRDLFLLENRDLVEDYLMMSKKGE